METEIGGGGPYRAPSVAPMLEKWVSACFPEGSESSLRELEEVIQEASDAAQDDYDEASANEWAGGGGGISSPSGTSTTTSHA